ncbi:MAG: lysoplasmalogenase [Rhizobiaceae bacterium]
MMFPFPGGIEQNENGLMIFAVLAAGLFLLRPPGTSGGKWAIIKTMPVAFFAWIAWNQSAPVMLVVGLALSALGDYLLAHEGERAFLSGLAAFFLAHIAYIVLFAAAGPLLLLQEPWRLALVLVFLLHAGQMAVRLSKAAPADMRIPVFAYIGAISLMGLSATAYASPILLVGVFLFVISDTLLAIGRFLIGRDDSRQNLVQPGVWITYVAAQVFILFGYVT